MEGSPTIDLADSGDYKLGYCQTEYDALLSIGFDSPGAARKKYSPAERRGIFFGAPAGIRTPDTLLKRQVLCLLSYWGISV